MSKEHEHGPVHHLGTPINTNTTKFHEITRSDRGESIDPEVIKNKWKRDIIARLRELEDPKESFKSKYQIVKFLLNKFATGTLDKNLLGELAVLYTEFEQLDTNTSDFEPSMEDLIDEIEIYAKEYVEKLMQKPSEL